MKEGVRVGDALVLVVPHPRAALGVGRAVVAVVLGEHEVGAGELGGGAVGGVADGGVEHAQEPDDEADDAGGGAIQSH